MNFWRRVRRWAANVAAWGMLLVAVGVAGLWVDRSHLVRVGCERVREDRHYELALCSGKQGLVVNAMRWWATTEPGPDVAIGFFASGAPIDEGGWKSDIDFEDGKARTWGAFGVKSAPDQWICAYAWGVAFDDYAVRVPHWFVLLVLLPWPIRRGFTWRTLRRRRKMGLCLKCGYDLRASLEGCPECGEEKITAKAQRRGGS